MSDTWQVSLGVHSHSLVVIERVIAILCGFALSGALVPTKIYCLSASNIVETRQIKMIIIPLVDICGYHDVPMFRSEFSSGCTLPSLNHSVATRTHHHSRFLSRRVSRKH